MKFYKLDAIRSDEYESELNRLEIGTLPLVSKNTSSTMQNLPSTLLYDAVITGKKTPPEINVF